MKQILLVIDCQKGFINSNTKITAEKISDLIYSKSFDYVIATKFVNYYNSPFVNILNYGKMRKDEEETELALPESSIERIDCILEKDKYSCLNKELLSKLYEVNGEIPSKIWLCGFDTDACVLKTAFDLFEEGIQPVVLKGYCNSSGGKVVHKNAISLIKRNLGNSSICI